MCLLLLLALNSHLQLRLGARHASLISQSRDLFMVLFNLVGSVLTAFGQFIVRSVLDTWDGAKGDGAAGLGLDDGHGDNWTAPSPPVKYPRPQDCSMIGKYLPCGDFLSKFYEQDLENFTYAEIHGSHLGVCASNTILSPQFLVYVLYPYCVCAPAIGADGNLPGSDVCASQACIHSGGTPKQHVVKHCSLVLSLCLLVLLCLPFHTSHALLFFDPGTKQPPWATPMASIFFQAYGLVPPLPHIPVPCHHMELMPSISQRKGIDVVLCSAWWSCTHTQGGFVQRRDRAKPSSQTYLLL